MDRNKYRCYAVFYELEGVQYRQYLDVVKGNIKHEKKPEMIIVMLNPGSCKPVDKKGGSLRNEVKPDATLHRIIHLLENKNINHARILNLSDIKQGKSQLFFKELKERWQSKQYNHSIFFRPVEELSNLVDNSMKVLFACGTNECMAELKSKALEYFNSNHFTILNKNEKAYHPLMRPIKKNETVVREKWIDIVSPYFVNNNAS